MAKVDAKNSGQLREEANAGVFRMQDRHDPI